MVYKILKLDEDKWTKFEFIHYYPGKFSLFLIFDWTIWGCYLNINISETSGPIGTKFYLKHHWGGGKAASDFWPDQIGTLVSRATDNSHRVIMGKILLAL